MSPRAAVPPRNRWLQIEIRHLAALQALAVERSFRGAADELGYVQSAVSQQLSALERVVGSRLVDRERGHKAVALTTEGELLLEHVAAIAAQLSLAKAELDALAEGRSGTVRLGIDCDVGPILVPILVRELKRRWPEIELELVETSDDELLGAIGAGELDACLTWSAATAGDLANEVLLRDRFVRVAGAGEEATVVSRLALGELLPGLAMGELDEGAAAGRELVLSFTPGAGPESPVERVRVLSRIVCADLERSMRPTLRAVTLSR